MQPAIALPGAIRDNPFRILSLPSSASRRDIQQQGDHLLVLSEMGAVPADDQLPWLAPPDRSPEAIRRAIHELNDGVRRVYAEAMWLPAQGSEGVLEAYEVLRAGRSGSVQRSSLPSQAVAILSLARLLGSPQSTDAWAAVAEDCTSWWLSPAWGELTSCLRSSHDPRLRDLDAERVRNATILAVAEFWRQAVLTVISREQYPTAVGILRATRPIHDLWPEAAGDLRREVIDALSKALADLLIPARSAETGAAGEEMDLASALREATMRLRSMRAGIEAIVRALESSSPDWFALNDAVAETYRQLAVAWNNRGGDSEMALDLLEDATAIPASEQVRARLATDLATLREIVNEAKQVRTLFAGFSPIDKAPTLYRINGIGQAMIGEEPIGDGRAISVLFFTALWIPIFALKRYVISREGDAYRFYLKGPLTSRQRWWNGIAAAVTALLALLILAPPDGGPAPVPPQQPRPQVSAPTAPRASPAPPRPATGEFEDQIVVGRSIGGIRLGWTINDAVRFAGRDHDGSWETDDGGRAYYWRLRGDRFANPDPELTAALIVFAHASGRIEQVQTTAAWFKTRSGIEVGHPRSVLLERIRPTGTLNWEPGYKAEVSRSGLGWAYKSIHGNEIIVMFVVFTPAR